MLILLTSLVSFQICKVDLNNPLHWYFWIKEKGSYFIKKILFFVNHSYIQHTCGKTNAVHSSSAPDNTLTFSKHTANILFSITNILWMHEIVLLRVTRLSGCQNVTQIDVLKMTFYEDNAFSIFSGYEMDTSRRIW